MRSQIKSYLSQDGVDAIFADANAKAGADSGNFVATASSASAATPNGSSNGAVEGSGSSNGPLQPLMQRPEVAVVAAGVQFVAKALKGADGLGGPLLAPQLLGFLPQLLRLQVWGQG